MKLRAIFFTILAVFLLVGCQRTVQNKVLINQAQGSNQNKSSLELVSPVKPQPAATSVIATTSDPQSLEMPKFLDYQVPFAAQAPYAVWDELHKEACEEASMIMVSRFYQQQDLTPHLMEQEILDLVEWQAANGYQVDLAADEVVEILEDYFKLEAKIIETVTAEEIKTQLTEGNLVIIPAAGRELHNPYFQTPGPIYHMLVIRGYDESKQEFITNDPGTKRGEGFRYDYWTLLAAIADWDWQLAPDGMTAEEIKQGRKVMITVSK